MNNFKNTSTINEALRHERLLRGWSQKDVANHLGTTTVTVNRWERGIQQPGPIFRLKLSALFGKSEAELGLLFTEKAMNDLVIPPSSLNEIPPVALQEYAAVSEEVSEESQPEQRNLTPSDPAQSLDVTEKTVGPWEGDEEASPASSTGQKSYTIVQSGQHIQGLERNAHHVPLSPETETTYAKDTKTFMHLIDSTVPLLTRRSASVSLPQQPRRSARLLFLIVSVFLVISVGIGASLLFTTTSTTSSAQKTMTTFCQALVEKDFQTAYDQFSHQVQQRVPISEIMKSYSACTTAPSIVSDAHPQCTLRLTTEANVHYWRLISLALDEEHHWKIDSWGASHKG